jgi:hypothetical protein
VSDLSPWLVMIETTSLLHPELRYGSHDSKCLQQPDDHRDHDDDIEQALDFAVHRDEGVDEPQQHPNNDQDKYDMDQWHFNSFP